MSLSGEKSIYFTSLASALYLSLAPLQKSIQHRLATCRLCDLASMDDVEAMDVEQPDSSSRKGRGRGGKGDKGEDGDAKGKGKGSGKRFEIKKWSAVAMWSWAICTDTCAICRNNLYEPSIEYQVCASLQSTSASVG